MYTLYFSRKEKIIEVKKATKVFQNYNFTDEAAKHNDCVYLCAKRKPLLEKASEIKQVWLEELFEELETIRQIKY